MKKQKLKIKIRKWFLFTEWGTQAVPYIFDLTNEDINDTEIALCIQEQIYGGENEKQNKER